MPWKSSSLSSVLVAVTCFNQDGSSSRQANQLTCTTQEVIEAKEDLRAKKVLD